MKEKFLIREYRDEDLPALALHWKESIRGWPPGFGAGGDWSPESVRQWLMREKYIACWLGWLGDKVVGFLSYCRHWEDERITYVQTFNVHPDYHGRSFGRKLLVTSVDRAVSDQVKRLDLTTWAANTEAMPLYKKCGFFWRPRTEVIMYNFLSVVLNNPMVRDFVGDAHWYELLRQPLEIKEDDELVDGCVYHRYTFEKDNRRIEALVDPSTAGLVGLVSDELTIRCDVPGRNHVAGFSHPVRWTLEWKGKDPVDIELDCRGGEGVEYELDETFSIKGRRRIDTHARVAPDVQPEEEEWLGKPTECRITVNGYEMRFCPGLRAVPPFKLTTSPCPLRLHPHETRRVVVNLDSRLPDDATFVPNVECDGDVTLAEPSDESPVSVPGEAGFGLGTTLKSEEPGRGRVLVGGKLTVQGEEMGIHPLTVHVGVAPGGKPIEIRDEDPEVTWVSNGFVTLKARRRSAYARLSLQGTDRPWIEIFPEKLGEPFSDEFHSTRFDVSVEEEEHRADVVYRASSRDFPGIELERHVTVGSGREVEVSVILHNNGERPFTGLLRQSISLGRMGDAVIPIRDRLVQGTRENWTRGNAPLPVDLAEYPEKWVAWCIRTASSGRSTVFGQIFPGAFRLNWTMRCSPAVEYAARDLAPGGTFGFPAIRLLVGVSGWQEVQKEALDDEPSKLPTRPVDFFHAESPILAESQTPTFKFHLWRKAPWKGRASIRLPDGSREETSSDNWCMDAPMEVVSGSVSEGGYGLKAVDYELSGLTLETSGRLPLIVPRPDSAVGIDEGHEGDYDYFRVQNGSIEFRVAPRFGGAMYRLSEVSDPERSLVASPFPEAAMWTWLNPWFGGASVEAWLDYRFYRSEFDGDPVKYKWRGFDWEGIRVTAKLQRQWRSLGMESLFLTRPGMPLVLNLVRFREEAGCSREIEVEFVLSPSVSENGKAPMTSLIEQNGRFVKVGQTQEGCFTKGELWVASYDPQSGKTLGSVILRGRVNVFHAGEEGQMIWMESPVRTFPGGTVEIASLYVVADYPEIIPVLAEATAQWDRVLATGETEPHGVDKATRLGSRSSGVDES